MEKLRTQLPHILTAQGGPLDVDTTVVQDIPSLLLTAKIAGAAAELGYEFAEVRRLVGLVGDNVGTVAGSIEKRVARADGTEVAKEMLSRLLHHPGDDDHNPSQSPKSKMRMRVNSNEPVLLLNLSMHDNGNREKEKETIKTLLPSLLTLLSTTPYNIRPVRVYIDTETYSPLSLNKTPSPPINSNSKASLPFDFSISILNVVNTELGGHSMVQLLDHPSASPGWAGKGLIGKEDWEALLQGGDGWSVEGVMGLVMKNYVGVVRGKEEEEDEKVGGAGQEQADEQAVPSDIPAQAHDGENHTTLSKGEMEAAAEAEAEKDQDQDEFMSTASLPESPSQKFETKAESDGGQKGDEAEQEVITHESGEAMDSGVGRAATGFDTARESGREPSAEDEEFEMVDREQTLIDMVLGRGRT